MKLGYKIWFEKDTKVFGKGPCELLKMIDQLGSLNKAAREIGMSYSKAWSIINNAEKELGFLLLNKKIGGSEGGGSLLTLKAKELIEQYEKFCNEVDVALNLSYEKYFENFF